MFILEKNYTYPNLPSDYLQKVLNFEGGYCCNKYDSGGETNRGITLGALNKAKQDGIVPYSVTIKSLTNDLESVRKIYEKNYYIRSRANRIPHPLSFCHFDAAVNNGIGGSGKFLQRTLNIYICKNDTKLVVDGGVGPLTINLLEKIIVTTNLNSLIIAYNNIREKYYYDIVANRPTQKKFLRGWLNRLNLVRKYTENI